MKQALIKLHVSVFLAGFTGVLGKLIVLNEGLLVWYRIMLTVATLFIILSWKKRITLLPSPVIWKLMRVGSLIALHWVCFYASIRFANVSIGLICFASVGLFTAILEPAINHKKINFVEVALGLISLVGILLIFHFDTRYRLGIIFGVASSILAALFSVINKNNVEVAPPQTLMLYELSGGLLLLTLLMPLYLQFFPTTLIFPTLSDWGWLLVLSWLCTVLAMNLMLQSLKKVSAFTQSLTLNLEPVYGVFLAFFLFHENKELQPSFYLGLVCIGLSVCLQMLRVVRGNG